MKKTILTLALAGALTLPCALALTENPTTANAETAQASEEISPRALTQLACTITANENYITAKVKNTFTLFSTTVRVTLKLYYSYSYTEDISAMTLYRQETIADLDQGNSFAFSIDNEAPARYWRVVADYTENGGAVKQVANNTVFIGLDGTIS